VYTDSCGILSSAARLSTCEDKLVMLMTSFHVGYSRPQALHIILCNLLAHIILEIKVTNYKGKLKYTINTKIDLFA